jgi:peptide-methionine (S)-S-oxide reductase
MAMKNIRLLAVSAAICALIAEPASAALKTAVFAGGCFWSMEKAFESLPGVSSAVSGYAGGTMKNPTYEDHRGNVEAVQVTYDDAKVSYAALTDYFFHHIDPTDANGMFCDQGSSYRSVIFAPDAGEQAAAGQVKAQVAKTLGKPVATEIRTSGGFWKAEDYHQDFAKKNPERYAAYRIGCGRDAALKAVWQGR